MALPLKDILPTLLPHDTTHWQIKLLANWSTIIGNLKDRVRLEKINKDTLILGVYDSCWMHELYLLSPLLLNTINQSLDQPYVKHLRFKRAVAKKVTLPQSVTSEKPAVSITLSSAQEEALSRIQDPQLRTALHNFLSRCNKENV